MSVPRFSARRQYPDAIPQSLNAQYWEVLDLAADKVILVQIPQRSLLDVVEQLNKAYDTGVKDGTVSERLKHSGAP